MADLKNTILITPRIDVPIGRTDSAGNVYFIGNFLNTFINEIIKRAGGQNAPSISDLAAAVVEDETQISLLQNRADALEASVASLQALYTALEARISALEDSQSYDSLIGAVAQTRALIQRLTEDVDAIQSGPRA